MNQSGRDMLLAAGPSAEWPWAVVMANGFTAADFVEITIWCDRELGAKGTAWDLHGNGWIFRQKSCAAQACMTFG